MQILVTVEHTDAGDWLVKCPVIPGCVVREESREKALSNARSAIKSNLDARAGRELALEIDLLPFHMFGERKFENVSWTGEKERIEALITEARSKPTAITPVRTPECLGRFRSTGFVRGGWSKVMGRDRRGPMLGQGERNADFSRFRRT